MNELMLPPWYVSPPHQAVNCKRLFDSSVDRRMSGLTSAARLNNVTLLLTIGLIGLVIFFG